MGPKGCTALADSRDILGEFICLYYPPNIIK